MFLQLAEHDEILGTGGASVSPQQIEQQLQVLTGDIIRITQARLRNQYSPHSQQREADGENTEPRRVLVVMGFPANFSTGAINDLLTITEHGPRYGISTIIVGDMTGLQSWSDDTLRRLEKAATMLTWDGQYFTWQDPDYQDCQLDLDALPPQDVFGRLLQEVARQALVSVSIEQNPLFKEALANPGWKAPRERVASWLGHPLAIKAPTAISFRRESGSNLLIVGKQEEVALGMLITTMVCLAAQNPPTLAQFSVLDLSIADLNALYGANTGPFEFFRQVLPRYTRQVMHRRDFRAHPSRFITGLSDELQERAGADDLEASSLYLVICGLPRVENVLQKDMLQGGEHISSSSVAKLLLDVLRRGPELGIHTLVACDKLSGLEGVLGSQALEHFDHRVVLRTISKDESNDLIEAPDAFALDEEHAIFFDKGRLEKFRPYRLPSKAWLEEAAMQIRQKSEI